MIEVRELSKTFHVHRKEPGFVGSLRSLFVRRQIAREAVRWVSSSVKEGEIVGPVGANGVGKTTLVKMLNGIIHPTSGEARVMGYIPGSGTTTCEGGSRSLWVRKRRCGGTCRLRTVSFS